MSSENTVELPLSLEACHTVIRQYHEEQQRHQAEQQELKQLVHQLMARIEKLEIENRELRSRLDTNSNNSSKPPSSDFKKNTPKKQGSGKSSGGQKGHRGHCRALMDESEVDKIVTHETFSPCQYCQGEIISNGRYVRHQVHELPVMKLTVTEYQLAIGQCRCCTRKQVASLPVGVSWGITGARLTSFMTLLVTKYQLSRRQLQEFLNEYFNFPVSLGTLFNKQRLVNRLLEQPVNELLPHIKESPSVNIDETGHRQSGKRHWTWVMASKTAAYFKITKSRGKKVLHTLMDDYEGVAISDRYSIYTYFDSQRQLCWAHLKRDFTRLSQHRDKTLSRIGQGLVADTSRLFVQWHRFREGEITREALLREAKPLMRSVGEYLEQASYTDPELRAARFCKNVLEHFSSLWRFLTEQEIEPTNNHAERCLRYLVIWRKKYFATQSDYGSEYVARTASLLITSKLQKKNPFHYLSSAIERAFCAQNIPPIIDTPIISLA